jgi:hypothetical protein
MNTEIRVKAKTQMTQSHKKTYTRPALNNYGAVRYITQAGASGANENGGGMMLKSDRNTKENIVQIGVHPLGIGLYLFDYKPEHRELCGHGRQFGVMADEVEAVVPDAVSVDPDGYKMVNYAMLGINHTLQ